MPTDDQPQTTLRDDLVSAFDAVESGGTTPDAPAIETQPAESAEPQEQKPSRTAGRARDEKGRLLPGPAQRDSAPQDTTNPTKPVDPSAAPAVAAHHPSANPAQVRVKHAWKKDFWDSYDKISQENPKLADYLDQREREYQAGVSTYKNLADSAKQLNDTIAPYLPVMQQHGVKPDMLIGNLLGAHQALALGSPQDKVMMGVRLIRDYGIDPQALYQVLTGQTPYQQPQVQQQRQQPQVNLKELVEQAVTEREIASEFDRFMADVPVKYQHYDEVKDTMAGLLQAGLAQDYQSAYEAALRHPRHAEIYEQMQEQQRLEKEKQSAQQQAAVVSRARSQAISTRSSTPGAVVQQPKSNGSLRDDLSASFDAVIGGRI